VEASFVELRTRSAEVIRALKRNERVTVMYRGKAVAVMHPVGSTDDAPRAADHAGFGLWSDRDDMADAADYVRELRGGRFRDL